MPKNIPLESPPGPVRMVEVLAAFSLATDLGTGKPMGHALRACYLGMAMARELRLSTWEQAELYYSFFLMHSGCAALSLAMAPVIKGDELAAIGDATLHDETNPLEMLNWMRRNVSPGAPLPARMLNLIRALLHGPNEEGIRGVCEVAAVVDSIGEPAYVLGHSLGALCVLEAALLTPNIRGLVAYEPSPAPVPDGLIERIEAALEAGDPEEAVIIFVRDLVRMPPDELEQWRSTPDFRARVTVAHTIPREFHAVVAYQPEPERFKEMNAPTLMLLGGDSPPFARENTDYWHAALPNSKVVVLPGQQHIAMDTAPDLFTGEVAKFLNQPG